MREDVPSSMHSRAKRGVPAHGRQHFGHDPIFYKRRQRERRLSQLWSEEGTYEDRRKFTAHSGLAPGLAWFYKYSWSIRMNR